MGVKCIFEIFRFESAYGKKPVPSLVLPLPSIADKEEVNLGQTVFLSDHGVSSPIRVSGMRKSVSWGSSAKELFLLRPIPGDGLRSVHLP